jgi:hypothetical protein
MFGGGREPGASPFPLPRTSSQLSTSRRSDGHSQTRVRLSQQSRVNSQSGHGSQQRATQSGNQQSRSSTSTTNRQIPKAPSREEETRTSYHDADGVYTEEAVVSLPSPALIELIHENIETLQAQMPQVIKLDKLHAGFDILPNLNGRLRGQSDFFTGYLCLYDG